MTKSWATTCDYRVQTGDSLSKIAQQKLGDGNAYASIKAQNQVTYPSLKYSTIIQPGWTLKVDC